MDRKKNWTTVTVVWMGLAALALGAFWHGWNLAAGEIPILTSVTWLTERAAADGAITRPAWILTLPFGLSRSWDMLGAALFVWIVCRLWRWAEVDKKDDVVVGLGLGLVVGLVGGLGLGLGLSLGLGLVVGLGLGLVVGLVGGLVVGLVGGLGYSFVIGLFWLGLLPGLAVFFIITAPLWFIIGVRVVYRTFKNRPRADWSGVKSLLSGASGNGNTE
ncbi:MAG: hypothetical protein HY481_01455 [Candidatus Vogelbacteria bacterium]|nr:hypothetical protein [Candidatus Vogelbacteria bacterium]